MTERDLQDYCQDGPIAQRVAAVIPYFPYKGIDRFYDITGFLRRPDIFQLVIDVFVERYRKMTFDFVGGIDARGFILGPPIALALKKPFFMIRKLGKLPNSISGARYTKEYAGEDGLCVPRGLLKKGDLVLLVDDLIATGGTLCAAVELIKQLGAEIVECTCVVELKKLNARAHLSKRGHHVPIWGLISEDILTLNGLEDSSIDCQGYVDDGLPHHTLQEQL